MCANNTYLHHTALIVALPQFPHTTPVATSVSVLMAKARASDRRAIASVDNRGVRVIRRTAAIIMRQCLRPHTQYCCLQQYCQQKYCNFLHGIAFPAHRALVK